MIQHDFVVALAEGYVGQIEKLAHTGKHELALRIKGGLSACVDILQRDAKEWTTRTDRALAAVSASAPQAPAMPEMLPQAAAEPLIPLAQTGAAKTGGAVVPGQQASANVQL